MNLKMGAKDKKPERPERTMRQIVEAGAPFYKLVQELGHPADYSRDEDLVSRWYLSGYWHGKDTEPPHFGSWVEEAYKMGKADRIGDDNEGA